MRPPYTPITCICINIRDTGLEKWVPVKLLILKGGARAEHLGIEKGRIKGKGGSRTAVFAEFRSTS